MKEGSDEGRMDLVTFQAMEGCLLTTLQMNM